MQPSSKNPRWWFAVVLTERRGFTAECVAKWKRSQRAASVAAVQLVKACTSALSMHRPHHRPRRHLLHGHLLHRHLLHRQS